jgi:hypothetical protein
MAVTTNVPRILDRIAHMFLSWLFALVPMRRDAVLTTQRSHSDVPNTRASRVLALLQHCTLSHRLCISSFVSLPAAQITGISIVNSILTGRRRHPSFWETIASLPVHKALYRTLSTAKLSSIQSTHTHFAKIHFNIIHPSTPEPPKRSPSACSSYALYCISSACPTLSAQLVPRVL